MKCAFVNKNKKFATWIAVRLPLSPRCNYLCVLRQLLETYPPYGPFWPLVACGLLVFSSNPWCHCNPRCRRVTRLCKCPAEFSGVFSSLVYCQGYLPTFSTLSFSTTRGSPIGGSSLPKFHEVMVCSTLKVGRLYRPYMLLSQIICTNVYTFTRADMFVILTHSRIV